MEAGFYNIQMWHKVFEIMFWTSLSIAGFIAILRVFAGITYKLAHKKTKHKKAHKRVQNRTEIEYNIGDKDKKYLFEIKQEKKQMRKELRECLNY